MSSIREYEETHLKETQRLQKERVELATQVGGWVAEGLCSMRLCTWHACGDASVHAFVWLRR